MIEFIGPTDDIQYLARQIAQMGRVDFITGLMTEMADKSRELVEQEFVRSADPYGNVWAPTKRATGRRILVKSSKLSRSIRRYVSTTSFRLRSAVPYSFFHQKGTRYMVARRIFPEDRELPPAWASEYEKIADRAITKLLAPTQPRVA